MANETIRPGATKAVMLCGNPRCNRSVDHEGHCDNKRPQSSLSAAVETHAALIAEIDEALSIGRQFPVSCAQYTVSAEFLRACRAALAAEKEA